MQISLNRNAGPKVLIAAAIAVLALSASACGGGKESSSAAATEAWAGGVCSAFTTWKTSLNEDVYASARRMELDQAASQLDDANKALVKSLKKLGPPNTASGATAKDDLSGLEDSLSTSMSTIKEAVSGHPSGSDFVSTVHTVSTELTKMSNSLSTTVADLNNADLGSEIEDAFKQAPSCSGYFSS